MKVQLVEIKKEWIDYDEKSGPCYKRTILPKDYAFQVFQEGADAPPAYSQYEDEVFEIQKVKEGGKTRYYFVKIDDRDLFRDLIEISNSKIDLYVRKKSDEIIRVSRLTREQGVDSENRRIKKLPWWKRLFNRF